MDRTVIVVIGCHFLNKDTVCRTIIRRLEEALYLSQDRLCYIPARGRLRLGVSFVTTGNVPYQAGGKTLAELMQNYLKDSGVSEDRIAIGRGVGMFSEARNVTRMISDLTGGKKRIAVVSSDWYFWPGAPIWKKFAKERGLEIDIHCVRGTGGWRTKMTYLIYSMLVRASLLFGCANRLERIMLRLQSGRTEGFTFNGCS